MLQNVTSLDHQILHLVCADHMPYIALEQVAGLSVAGDTALHLGELNS